MLSSNISLQIVESWRLANNRAMITPAQCRAARGLLAWSQQTLANRAGVGLMTVNQFEKEDGRSRRATLEVIRRAFEAAGVTFIDENGGGAGVRLRKTSESELQPKKPKL